MNHRAYTVMGLALLGAVILLHVVADDGLGVLIAGPIVLLLGRIPRPQRRLRLSLWDDLRSWVPTLTTVLAISVGVGTLLQLTLATNYPAAGLAWFARVLCLGAITLLPHTRPPALVLHGLVVILSVWTTSALATSGVDPGLIALTVVVLALAAHGLLLGRSCELSTTASASITTGVAPTPWGQRPHRSPAGVVTLLALIPVALGIALPRPSSLGPWEEGSGSGPGPRSVSASANDVDLPALSGEPREVGFSPEIRLGAGHSRMVLKDTVVARVTAEPDQPGLLLRGAALERATDDGFLPATHRLPEPFLAPHRRKQVLLSVTLEQPQARSLFVIGQAIRFRGVSALQVPRGYAVMDVKYPLRYTVLCHLAYVPDKPRGHASSIAPSLLYLPPAIRMDSELTALAKKATGGGDPHARAVRAIRWLNARCTYDLQTSRASGLDLRGVLRSFLLEERRGVCEEFSMTLVVFLRRVGVPARVVAGYRATERDEQGFVLRARDAHAWVEIPIRGLGWMPYDPTPSNAPGSAGQRERVDPSGGTRTRTGPRPEPPPLPDSGIPDDEPESVDSPTADEDESPTESLIAMPTWLLVGVLLLAALLGAGFSALARRRVLNQVRSAQLGRDAVAAPDLMTDRARLFAVLEQRGFQLDGPQTPLEFVSQLERLGLDDPTLRLAVGHYIHLRFSGRSDPPVRAELHTCLRRLR